MKLALALFLSLAFVSPVAHATGKPPKQPKPAKTTTTVSSESSAGARSDARGEAFSAVATIDESRTTFEAAANSAASATEAWCGAGGVSGQGAGFGVALAGSRDRACAWFAYAEARLNLGDRYADAGTGIRALLGSLEELDLKGKQGKVAAVDTVTELATRVYGAQLAQYAEAEAALTRAKNELELDNTLVRRVFVTTFGSLPLLNSSPITPR